MPHFHISKLAIGRRYVCCLDFCNCPRFSLLYNPLVSEILSAYLYSTGAGVLAGLPYRFPLREIMLRSPSREITLFEPVPTMTPL